MRKIVEKPCGCRLRLTLVETLLTLMIVSFIYLGLSGIDQDELQQVEEKYFFAEFEHLYQESRKISWQGKRNWMLKWLQGRFKTPYQTAETRFFIFARSQNHSFVTDMAPSLATFTLSDTERSGKDLITKCSEMGKLKKHPFASSHRILSCFGVYLLWLRTLLLGEIRTAQGATSGFQRGRVLSVAQMALQTGQNHLEANGIQVQVEKMPISSRSIIKGRWYCME